MLKFFIFFNWLLFVIVIFLGDSNFYNRRHKKLQNSISFVK